MVDVESGLTEGGGIYLEVTDENGDTRRVEFEPTTNGRMNINVETPDGVRKAGEVEPGSAVDRGLGR